LPDNSGFRSSTTDDLITTCRLRGQGQGPARAAFLIFQTCRGGYRAIEQLVGLMLIEVEFSD